MAPDNYYSEQDAEKAITIGEAVLAAHPDIDVIICNDSTALPGQLQAAENKGYNQDNITITGFASPNAIKEYCSNGTLYNWGLWDCAATAETNNGVVLLPETSVYTAENMNDYNF